MYSSVYHRLRSDIAVISLRRTALILLVPRVSIPRRQHLPCLLPAIRVLVVRVQAYRNVLSVEIPPGLMCEVLSRRFVTPLVRVVDLLADGLVD